MVGPAFLLQTLFELKKTAETKDPVQDSLVVEQKHRLVLVEGIYLALNVEPWSQGHQYFDQIWLLECQRGRARERLIERHVLTGVTSNKSEAAERGVFFALNIPV